MITALIWVGAVLYGLLLWLAGLGVWCMLHAAALADENEPIPYVPVDEVAVRRAQRSAS